MAENSKIEWTDTFDPQAIGRQLGAYKSAAKRIGCSFEEWMAERAAGRRRCFRCKTWKSNELFSIDRSRKGGLTATCKECTSEASTASRYGLSRTELNDLRQTHQGHCPICLGTDSDLVVDHDHDDGSVRGLLCSSCNVGLGLFGDDVDNLKAAIHYLENHNGRKLKN